MKHYHDLFWYPLTAQELLKTIYSEFPLLSLRNPTQPYSVLNPLRWTFLTLRSEYMHPLFPWRHGIPGRVSTSQFIFEPFTYSSKDYISIKASQKDAAGSSSPRRRRSHVKAFLNNFIANFIIPPSSPSRRLRDYSLSILLLYISSWLAGLSCWLLVLLPLLCTCGVDEKTTVGEWQGPADDTDNSDNANEIIIVVNWRP